jgi:hypothetical protein
MTLYIILLILSVASATLFGFLVGLIHGLNTRDVIEQQVHARVRIEEIETAECN